MTGTIRIQTREGVGSGWQALQRLWPNLTAHSLSTRDFTATPGLFQVPPSGAAAQAYDSVWSLVLALLAVPDTSNASAVFSALRSLEFTGKGPMASFSGPVLRPYLCRNYGFTGRNGLPGACRCCLMCAK